MNWRTGLGLIAVATFLAGGTSAVLAEEDLPPAPSYSGTSVKTITATLRASSGSDAGAVQLSQDSTGVVQVMVSGSGLAPGVHGIHVHAAGLCEGPAFTTAAGHFNPAVKKHGLLAPDGHHNGDLRNLTVAANGTVTYLDTTNTISLTGGAMSIFDADGTALVVHAAADDYLVDPTGNSGARVACAVLAAPNAALASPTAGTSPTVTVPLPPRTGTGAAGSGGFAWQWLAIPAAIASTIVVFGLRGQIRR